MIQKLRWNNGVLEALIAKHVYKDNYIKYELAIEWKPVPQDYFAQEAIENARNA